MQKNFLVYTPFRCGSSFLTRLVGKNLNKKAIFVNQLPSLNLSDDSSGLIFKGHNDNIAYLKNIKIDYIITSIRRPTEIFYSSFFKDINNPNCPYYFRGYVHENNLEYMLEHFLQQPWESYEWLSYDFNFQKIKELTGINLWEYDTTDYRGYKIIENEPKIILINHSAIKNNYEQIKNLFQTELHFQNLDMSRFSFRNSDVFGDLYYKFIKSIPSSFYEKYKHLDEKIMLKFYKILT